MLHVSFPNKNTQLVLLKHQYIITCTLWYTSVPHTYHLVLLKHQYIITYTLWYTSVPHTYHLVLLKHQYIITYTLWYTSVTHAYHSDCALRGSGFVSTPIAGL